MKYGFPLDTEPIQIYSTNTSLPITGKRENKNMEKYEVIYKDYFHRTRNFRITVEAESAGYAFKKLLQMNSRADIIQIKVVEHTDHIYLVTYSYMIDLIEPEVKEEQDYLIKAHSLLDAIKKVGEYFIDISFYGAEIVGIEQIDGRKKEC